MSSVNKVILVGNLGRDPDMRYTPGGEPVAKIRIATTDRHKDKSGVMKDQTEWHDVSFFGRQAEVCKQYLKKGSQVYVEGAIKTRKYTDKEGIEKFVTEIRGDRMQMLGGRGLPAGDEVGSAAPAGSMAQKQANGGKLTDDIPFNGIDWRL